MKQQLFRCLQLFWVLRTREPKPVETNLTDHDQLVTSALAADYEVKAYGMPSTYSIVSKLKLKSGKRIMG
jgi:hypothetical protein